MALSALIWILKPQVSVTRAPVTCVATPHPQPTSGSRHKSYIYCYVTLFEEKKNLDMQQIEQLYNQKISVNEELSHKENELDNKATEFE